MFGVCVYSHTENPKMLYFIHHSFAERSKAAAQGAIPKGRGLEFHSCQFVCATLTNVGWHLDVVKFDQNISKTEQIEATHKLFVERSEVAKTIKNIKIS